MPQSKVASPPRDKARHGAFRLAGRRRLSPSCGEEADGGGNVASREPDGEDFKSLEVKAKDIISNYFNRKLVAEKLDQIMELPAKPIGEEPLKVHRRMNILTASMMRADRVRYQYR
eukprot:CAMPEP_0114525952 /NCGR_PEP_ID=MMETSP0109-20121206/22723_1 /TAXON_ID=29199 /ORGANISM="Chlorarachnion reptans, Strain CCCM449" /LENGTH=115 /DNA_ID=CAMNT_0001707617 /DNA_START=182 /DNA_END=527 /DNA_ORIENTATION=-